MEEEEKVDVELEAMASAMVAPAWKLCGGASVWCDCAYACSSMHAKQWCSPRETFQIYHPLIISSLSTGVNVCVFSNVFLLGRQ